MVTCVGTPGRLRDWVSSILPILHEFLRIVIVDAANEQKEKYTGCPLKSDNHKITQEKGNATTSETYPEQPI